MNKIEINGTIDSYSYSKGYVKFMLKEFAGQPVTVQVNSLGGNVDDALNIMQQFRDHGDVTVEYIGFNASAATLIGLAAAKSTIREDAFYLIHKASIAIDVLGQLNSDEIQEKIDEFTTLKQEAEKVTLTLAKLYMDKSGKSLADVLAMMKEATWLTGKEAVDNGFVDELVKATTKKKTPVTNQMRVMMNCIGLPDLPQNALVDETPGIIETLVQKWQDFEAKFSLNNNPQIRITMNKDLSFVNQVLGLEGVELVENNFSMTLEQLTAFNNRIETLTNEKQQAEDAKATAEASLETAKTEKTEAETALNTVVSGLDALHETVETAENSAAKVAAVKNLLSKLPANIINPPKPNEDGKPDFSNCVDPVNEYYKPKK